MNSIFKIIFKNRTKPGPVYVKNLPQLIDKIKKNEIEAYKKKFLEDEIEQSDPLLRRIHREELDYISEFYKELSNTKRYITIPIKRKLARIFPRLRYEREISRPNEHLREVYFGLKNREIVGFVILVLLFLSYSFGYFWAKLKYDIYTRRYFYTYYFNLMILFEYADYHFTIAREVFDSYFPREFSEKEYEYILYRKLSDYFIKRKMNKKMNDILNEDPEIFEIDEILKKIKD